MSDVSVAIVAPITLGENGLSRNASITLVNNTAKVQVVYTVPAGKEAIFNWMGVYNGDDVQRAIHVVIKNSGDDIRCYIFNNNCGATSWISFPNNDTGGRILAGGTKIIMVAGDYVEVTFSAGGASSGGTSIVDGDIREYPI